MVCSPDFKSGKLPSVQSSLKVYSCERSAGASRGAPLLSLFLDVLMTLNEYQQMSICKVIRLKMQHGFSLDATIS